MTPKSFTKGMVAALKSLAKSAVSESPATEREESGGGSITEKTYESFRLSSGNFLFPDSVLLASDGILFRKPSWFGSKEKHISYRAVASSRAEHGIFLSDVFIETSGGSHIVLTGLRKSDAEEIQHVIRAFQRRGPIG